jgi:hypothetical protein
MNTRNPAYKLTLPGMALLLLCACHPAASTSGNTKEPADSSTSQHDETSSAAKNDSSEAGVSLAPEEIQKLGVLTTEARAITSKPELPGFALVLPHETIAQAVADLRTANAAEHQSRLAFARTHRLSGTPGAMPADIQETAERQLAADRAALTLARQRLSATFGQNPPWKNNENSPELLALTSGQAKLVRVTFPLGSLGGDVIPERLRVAHIDASRDGRSWESNAVWRAPADASVPGQSFFAILTSGDVSEGEHLLAWAPIGAAEPGVLIPTAAALISGGQFWCYVEEKPGTFVRTAFDPGQPVAGGYFVKEGISAGDKIVTAAAGQLLAREMNPSTEAE